MRSAFLFLVCFATTVSPCQVLHFESLRSTEIASLDPATTVVILPGVILEQHGPYLPAGSDGIFNAQMATDLAKAVANRPGWKAVVVPALPLGAGAANEIGEKYVFPGSLTVLPSTLRAVYMDWADQLGQLGFRWVFVVNGHGDPAHNRMIDIASQYFHDTYGGEMVNLFGYVWAEKHQDLRSKQQQNADGIPEHATMTESSVIMALAPELVSKDIARANPIPAHSPEELISIAKKPGWPGYFGAPALASGEFGKRLYDQWLESAKVLLNSVLRGENYRRHPTFAALYADDESDVTAAEVNRRLEEKHKEWLAKRAPAMKR